MFIGSATYNFKLEWNTQIIPLHWYQWSPLDEKSLNLDRRNPQFRAAIEIWKRLPCLSQRCWDRRLQNVFPNLISQSQITTSAGSSSASTNLSRNGRAPGIVPQGGKGADCGARHRSRGGSPEVGTLAGPTENTTVVYELPEELAACGRTDRVLRTRCSAAMPGAQNHRLRKRCGFSGS